jgi:hypothetical protein
MTDTYTISLSNTDSTSATGATLNSDGSVTGPEGVPPTGNTFTDVVYQPVKLYIEGVQVPFIAISISQAIGTYPSAMISVPPQAGLMDIARYYQPKIHIFYTDQVYGGDRLLFWGHIARVEYSRSRNPASSSISFQCVHKNELMKLVTLDYNGYVGSNMTNSTDPNPEQAALKVDLMTSELSIINALSGVTGVQTAAQDVLGPSNTQISEADVTKIAPQFQGFLARYSGIPGSMMNIWNQFKRQCYMAPAWSSTMTSMYIPLVENGLKFFNRISGHYLVESYAESHREQYCPHDIPPSDVKYNLLVPPSSQLPSVSAMKTALTVYAVKSQMGYSGEMTDFITMMNNFFYSVEYEYLTLASPAAVAVNPTTYVNPDVPSAWAAANRMAVETIIKPQTPFYYAPVCNVVYPNMFSTISVTQDEANVPTRVTAYTDMLPNDGGGALNTFYRAPESVREAVAVGVSLANASGAQNAIDLLSTTGPSYNVPGKYEEARGVVQRKVVMPNWLSFYVADQIPNVGDPNNEAWPAQGTQDYTDLVNMHAAWVDRYGYDITENDGVVTRTLNTSKDVMDPNSPQSQIAPFQRMLFNTADYEFAKAIEQARSGMIEMVFNPYIVCGYPMDIIDSSPNYPCFHATCASVTHTITASSINTSVSFVGAMTYAEMSTYYIPPVAPWLQNILNVNNVQYGTATASNPGTTTVPSGQVGPVAYNSPTTYAATSGTDSYGSPSGTIQSVEQTLINNPTALAAATDYYRTTLGVGAADPSLLYAFDYGQPSAVSRSNGMLASGFAQSAPDSNGIETNPYRSSNGNLSLTARQIEGKEAIMAAFGIKFIDLDPTLYSQQASSYLNPILDKSILLEPGASLFVDYQITEDFINASSIKQEIQNLNTTNTSTT